MQDKDYLKWCADKDKGIKLVDPSENIVRAYLEKSRRAIKSMELNANADLMEWAVSASYYARYFSVYAVMSKIGVKCEIHAAQSHCSRTYSSIAFRTISSGN